MITSAVPGSGSGWRVDLLIVVAILSAGILTPRWIDGRAALEWAEHHATLAVSLSGRSSRRAAELAGRNVARAIERTAPMPLAAEAAQLGLDLGAQIEPHDAEAASLVYGQVRTALARVTTSPIRGFGLRLLATEAQARAEALNGRRKEVQP